ncbi:HTTM domain-containing protein [Kriegella sp. EG-1]|nr:HTTM domain-containing protein [Flavobacteriaceae bacterium EG-1]
MISDLGSKLLSPKSILPLVVFRIAFGLLLCFSQLRFMFKGWIEACYTSTDFHFTYQYFDWIKPFDLYTMYIIVIASAVFALCIALGFLYRIASVLFFLSFTYLELIEKSWYLNHYYFASLIAFLLIWLPAHRNYSADCLIFKNIRLAKVPNWTILILRLQIAAVYFFGGIAKLKSDWLLDAQPLKIWLKARTETPIIGTLFEYDLTAYIFSYTGVLYDLTIPFLLFCKRTRPWAYVLVVVFHVLTYILFNIGMFPWIMIAASLIFISAKEWTKILELVGIQIKEQNSNSKSLSTNRIALPLLSLYIFFQLTFPLRHYLLSNNVLWTENGLRFAWHVMIMEKNGFAEFTVVDNDTNRKFTVYPSQYLSVIQEKQMSFQPDMIWQFARYLKQNFDTDDNKNLSIYVNSKVALNGRGSQTFIASSTDLLRVSSVDNIYKFVVDLED